MGLVLKCWIYTIIYLFIYSNFLFVKIVFQIFDNVKQVNVKRARLTNIKKGKNPTRNYPKLQPIKNIRSILISIT